MLYSLGRNEEALFSYDRALAIKSDFHEAWYNRGNVLGNLGRNEEALFSYDKALAIKSDFHEAWSNRGFLLKQLGKNEEAISCYDKALDIKPNFHEVWYNKACVYAIQNNLELTLDNLHKAILAKAEEYRELAKTYSDFDNIRHDPRFQALIK